MNIRPSPTFILLLIAAGCSYPDTSRLYSRCEVPLDQLRCPVFDPATLTPERTVPGLRDLGCELVLGQPMEGVQVDSTLIVPIDEWQTLTAEEVGADRWSCEATTEMIDIDPASSSTYGRASLICPSSLEECPSVESLPTPHPICSVQGPVVELGAGLGVASVTRTDGGAAALWYSGDVLTPIPQISWLNVGEEGLTINSTQRPCERALCGELRDQRASRLPSPQASSIGDTLLLADLCDDGHLVQVDERSCREVFFHEESNEVERVLSISGVPDSEAAEERLVVLWSNGAYVLSTALPSILDFGVGFVPPEPSPFWNPNTRNREAPSIGCFRESGDERCLVSWITPAPGTRVLLEEDEQWRFDGSVGEIQWQALGQEYSTFDAGGTGLGHRTEVVVNRALLDIQPVHGVEVWRDPSFGIVASPWSADREYRGGRQLFRGFSGATVLQVAPGRLEANDSWTVSAPSVVSVSRDVFLFAWWRWPPSDGDTDPYQRQGTLVVRLVKFQQDSFSLEHIDISLDDSFAVGSYQYQEPPIVAWHRRTDGELSNRGRLLLGYRESIERGERLVFHVFSLTQTDLSREALNLTRVDNDEVVIEASCNTRCDSEAVALDNGFAVAFTTNDRLVVLRIDDSGTIVDTDEMSFPMGPFPFASDLTVWAPEAAQDALLVAYTTHTFGGGVDGDEPRLGSDLELVRFQLTAAGLGERTGPVEVAPAEDRGMALHPNFADGPVPMLSWTELNVEDLDEEDQIEEVRGDIQLARIQPSPLTIEPQSIPAARLSDLEPEMLIAEPSRCPDTALFSDREECLLVSFSALSPTTSLEQEQWQDLVDESIGGLAVGALSSQEIWSLPGEEEFADLWLLPSGLLSQADGVLAAYTAIDPITREADRVEVFWYDIDTGEVEAQTIDATWLTEVGASSRQAWTQGALHLQGRQEGDHRAGGALWTRHLEDGLFNPDEVEPDQFEPNAELLFVEVDDQLEPTSRALRVDSWFGSTVRGGEIGVGDTELSNQDMVIADFITPHYNSALVEIDDGRYVVVWRRDELEGPIGGPTISSVAAQLVVCD